MIPDNANAGQRYDPIWRVTTEEEAAAYFEECVDWQMRMGGYSREEAVNIEKINIGYWAGYGPMEDMQRIHKLFKLSHPG